MPIALTRRRLTVLALLLAVVAVAGSLALSRPTRPTPRRPASSA
jgi:hypothetical protein